MKFNLLKSTALALGLTFIGSTIAMPITDTVTFSQSIDIVEEGQEFAFNITGDADTVVAENIILDNAVFFVNASGDFTSAIESLSLFGGNIVLNGAGVSLNGFELFSPTPFISETSFDSSIISERRDVDFSAEFSVDPVLAEGTLDVILNGGGFFIDAFNSFDVSTFFADGFSGTNADFVEVGFTFGVVDVAEVPEPTTLAIFALGLIGLASRRFKKG